MLRSDSRTGPGVFDSSPIANLTIQRSLHGGATVHQVHPRPFVTTKRHPTITTVLSQRLTLRNTNG
jgi:hypothetical protein